MSDDRSNVQETSVSVDQRVAILVDGNNIGKSVWALASRETMIDYDLVIPNLVRDRKLTRLIYFREGNNISSKFERRIKSKFFGSVEPSGRNAIVPITIKALQLADRIDTLILMSGNDDFVELVAHLKSNGLRVEIASVASSTSARLKEEADDWIDINEKYFFTVPTLAPRTRVNQSETSVPRQIESAESGPTISIKPNVANQEDLFRNP